MASLSPTRPEVFLPPLEALGRLPIVIDDKNSPVIFHYGWHEGSLPAVTCAPSQLAFSSPTMGAQEQQTATLRAPSPSEKVLVSVTGDTSGGMFTAAFVTTFTITLPQSPDGPHGPPGSPPQTKTEQLVTATTSASNADEALTVQVSFTPGSVAANYQASIVVQGNGWQPLTIPVTAMVTTAPAQPVAVAPAEISGVAISSLTIAQGGSATLGVHVSSSATEPVAVQLVYMPDSANQIGLTMAPVTVTVSAGGTVQTGLTFSAGVNAVVIANAPLTIYGWGPNMSCTLSGPTATVTCGPMTVVAQGPGSPQPSIIFTQGYPQSIVVDVTLAGEATEIGFEIPSGPQGISLLESTLYSLAAGSTQQITLQFAVAEGAPINFSGNPLMLNWYAYGDKASGSIEVRAYIFSEFECNAQQQSNWCWAATSVNIANYYVTASDFTQCMLATDLLGIDGCCANPAACNQGYEVEAALKVTGNWVQTYTTDTPYYSATAGPIGYFDLINQMNLGLPVAIRIQWEPGTSPSDFQHPAHAIAVSNFDLDSLFVVNDPIYGVSAIPYETLVHAYRGTGIWTHGYTTTTGATPAGFAA